MSQKLDLQGKLNGTLSGASLSNELNWSFKKTMQTTATHPNPFQTSGKMAAWCNIGLLIRLRSPHFFRIPLQVQVSILGGRYVHFDAWKVVCGRHVFSSFKPQAARNTKKNKDTEFQNKPSFRGLYEGKIVPLFFSILEQLFHSHRSCWILQYEGDCVSRVREAPNLLVKTQPRILGDTPQTSQDFVLKLFWPPWPSCNAKWKWRP